MVEEGSSSWIRWIPLLPLLAVSIHLFTLGLLRRPLPRRATIAISCGAPIVSFVLSFAVLLELTALSERTLTDSLSTWIAVGDFGAELALRVDPLASVMMLLVTGVGSWIHVFAIGAMDEDPRSEDRGFNRFFAYLNGLTFSMLVLVMGDNLLVVFLGWQGVGLASALLIGFSYADDEQADAGLRAFLIDRFADAAFLVGLLALYWSLAESGSATIALADLAENFAAVSHAKISMPFLAALGLEGPWHVPSLIGVSFGVAALARGAQVPLHGWLASASRASAPALAFVLATTAGVAGVYLLCRLGFVYDAAPGASHLIAWVGAMTALLAAVAATTQLDLPRAIAFVTLSQLGTMFLAVGVGAYSAAMFHVVTSAFSLSLLWLGSGSLLLSLYPERDIDNMGGLRRVLPRTYWTFLVGVAAVAGFPFLSGFYAGGGVLFATRLAEAAPGAEWLYASALATTGLTALATARVFVRVFHGSTRVAAVAWGSIQERGSLITLPLAGLALFAFFGGFLGPSAALNPFPVDDAASNSFANYLDAGAPAAPLDEDAPSEQGVVMLATLISALAAWGAWSLYARHLPWAALLRRTFDRPLEWARARSGHGRIIERAIVLPLRTGSERLLDRGFEIAIDRIALQGTARAVRALAGDVLKHVQSGLLSGSLFWMAIGSLAVVAYLAG